MSGYLQRLASQPVKPQGTVRPLVNPFTGPVNIAARLARLDEGPPEETVFTSVTQSKSLLSKTEIPPEMRGEDSKKVLGQKARQPVVRESEGSSPYQPLLSRTDEVLPAHTDHAAKAPLSGQDGSREESYSVNAHNSGSEEIVVEEGALASGGKDLTRTSITRRPLGEGAVREVHPHEVRILSPSPVRRPEPHPLRNSISASRGADEIQINIGRIEVTAMPQATPRPAPPVRKSINLDEYLSRRNGRNG